MPMSKEERYKVAARQEIGMQREQQFMTAGAQNSKTDAETVNNNVMSCAVICRAPLKNISEQIEPHETELSLNNFKNLQILKYIGQAGVVSIKNLENVPVRMVMGIIIL